MFYKTMPSFNNLTASIARQANKRLSDWVREILLRRSCVWVHFNWFVINDMQKYMATTKTIRETRKTFRMLFYIETLNIHRWWHARLGYSQNKRNKQRHQQKSRQKKNSHIRERKKALQTTVYSFITVSSAWKRQPIHEMCVWMNLIEI